MLVTVEQTKQIYCPLAAAKCRGPNCMAWRWGKDRKWQSGGPIESLQQWLRDNPQPAVDPTSDEQIAAWEAWTARADEFARSLEPTPRPAGDGWEWAAGFDEEEYTPFAHWYRPPARRGYCGLAGPVAEEA